LEHRFGDNFPLYAQARAAASCCISSEHHGDACPGSATMIAGGHDEVIARSPPRTTLHKPGIEDEPWGARVMKVTDPFGNRLIFAEPNAKK
jgi:hypothetical protein